MNGRSTLILTVGVVALSACATPGGSSARLGNLAVAPTEVVIDAGERHQTIDGFGTCLISWDANMANWYRRPEAVQLYVNELRFNILRANLWGDGTIGPKANPADIKHTDPEFAKTDSRTPVFLNFAQAARKLNPQFRLIGTVWSPPAWMKENNSLVDKGSGAIDGGSYTLDRNGQKSEGMNRVKRDYYPHFAQWVTEMVKHYEANGVPVYAVSAANEPQFTQDFESCLWTASDLATITLMTADRLNLAGLGRVKLFGPETMSGFNWNGGPNSKYTEAFRTNPAAMKSLGFWATHGYADGVKGDTSSNSLAQFWAMIANDQKPYWVTEGGTGGHAWPEPVREGGVGLAIHHAMVAGNVSAFVPWQFAENSQSEHNLMPLNGLNKKTHVVRHYSRYILAGAVRIGATPGYGSIHASAYRRANDVTIVLLNASDAAQSVKLSLKGLASLTTLNQIRTSATEDSKTIASVSVKQGAATVEVPGPSIVTLTTLAP